MGKLESSSSAPGRLCWVNAMIEEMGCERMYLFHDQIGVQRSS